MDRYPAQHPYGLVNGPADLEHVADYQRDAEALTDLWPPPER